MDAEIYPKFDDYHIHKHLFERNNSHELPKAVKICVFPNNKILPTVIEYRKFQELRIEMCISKVLQEQKQCGQQKQFGLEQ